MADKRIDQLTTMLLTSLTPGTMWLAIGRDGASAQKLDAAVLLASGVQGQTNYTTAGPHSPTTSAYRYTNLGAAVEMDINLWSPIVGDWCMITRMPSANYAIRVDPQPTHYLHEGGQGKYLEILEAGSILIRCFELTRWTIDGGSSPSYDYEI